MYLHSWGMGGGREYCILKENLKTDLDAQSNIESSSVVNHFLLLKKLLRRVKGHFSEGVV